MRWDFIDPNSPSEIAAKADMIARIDAWWLAFAAVADRIDRQIRRVEEFELVEFMIENFRRHWPKVAWEMGPALKKDGHRLVLTPETDKFLRPMVRTMIERAPQLERWEFYAHRPADSVEHANAIVAARTEADVSSAAVRVSTGMHRRVDLFFYNEPGESFDEGEMRAAAFGATETILGEEILDKWIGQITAKPLELGESVGKGGLVTLSRLRERVMALIESQIEQLPADPRWKAPVSLPQDEKDESGNSIVEYVIELQQNEREEYPGWTDLFVATTPEKDLWSAAHLDSNFYSERFSRKGETFCYLKLDQRGQPPTTKLGERPAIEKALNDGLIPAHSGCVTGSGSGTYHTYIELALTDVIQSIEIIRKILREGEAPKRSWLLFHDCELADEWVGIWDETPPPPPVKKAEPGRADDEE